MNKTKTQFADSLATENWYVYFSLINIEPLFFFFFTSAVRKLTGTSEIQIYDQFIHLNVKLLVLFSLVPVS